VSASAGRAPVSRGLLLVAVVAIAALGAGWLALSGARSGTGSGPSASGLSGPPPPVLAASRNVCSPPFFVGRWPGACWRPYGQASPFNQRLPDSPRVSPDSGRIVSRFTAAGGPADLVLGAADTSSDWEHPTYWARRSDPKFRLRCQEDRGGSRCEIEGHRIRIPRRARPAAGGDGHMTIVDPAHRWEYDLYEVSGRPRRGRVNLRWGGRTRVAGPRSTGLASDATAAHFGLLAGVIRPGELLAGRIRHALFVRSDCDNGRFVFPALGRGAKCSNPAGAPPEGARFQLAMSEEQLAGLDVPNWKRTILRAMAEYGFFVGDTGGSPWDVVIESGSTYTSFGYRDPWVALARSTGASSSDGRYYLDLAGGVDWGRHLRVLEPCVSRRTC
jgi:hypothetical protein